MEKGPFNLGRFSVPLNIISIIWICFFSIILCFPAVNPVDAQSMNYASLMIGGVLVLSLGFWFAVGHKRYTGPVHTAE
jgi:hypothetical protein